MTVFIALAIAILFFVTEHRTEPQIVEPPVVELSSPLVCTDTTEATTYLGELPVFEKP